MSSIPWSDSTKTKSEFGWILIKNSFKNFVKIMVDGDMNKVGDDDATTRVRVNLEEYLEKRIVNVFNGNYSVFFVGAAKF